MCLWSVRRTRDTWLPLWDAECSGQGGAGPGPVRVLTQSDNSFPAGQSQLSNRGDTASWHTWQRGQSVTECHEGTSPRPWVTTQWSAKVWSYHDEISWAQALRPQSAVHVSATVPATAALTTNLQSGQEIIWDMGQSHWELSVTFTFHHYCLSPLLVRTSYSNVRREVGVNGNTKSNTKIVYSRKCHYSLLTTVSFTHDKYRPRKNRKLSMIWYCTTWFVIKWWNIQYSQELNVSAKPEVL